ncbi:putative Peroxisomal membrane protein [Taphrina deformans PYCC 5710]|uniref:Peroxisomal membrane protein n=1 Tax=Taphrina deformans (strain PYCC 5710 / ATCC 11124 / CBS 356.35 / IMI 108563 / JCM 9778 / NBRC 8474) TaxID=1097556 RepID=R4X8L8_TAPDE|nr:putative Peroxisomal membrane protein [Taphrina deformans PYCC 5710]|eukprot:CCG81705.1 putative Peroxisomal membrane protein [Taphrina deformans PYCC 5710]
MDPIRTILLDPNYHDVLAILKGFRNGLVYGAKIRAPHATVMVFLFRGGTLRQKLNAIFTATSQHALNLARYVTIYKTCLLILRKLRNGKGRKPDSVIAGLIGGYVVFGESNSINQQIVLYVFSRIVIGFTRVLMISDVGTRSPALTGLSIPQLETVAWPLFASTCWASVMFLHDWYPETLQSSLANSMRYLYNESDQWDSLCEYGLLCLNSLLIQ